jgi:archaeal type IV pilus assembly protein PilA
MKIFKSKKALSPVVAAIILIAVTVAVSIAVAAWMGALTFTFMKTEELKVQGHTWATGNTSIALTVKNTGTSALTLSEARVNDVKVDTSTFTPATLDPGLTSQVVITRSFTSGTKYEFAVLTATGNKYTYVATAP